MFDVASLGLGTCYAQEVASLSTDARRAMWLSQPFNGSTFACMCEWLCVSALADRGDLSSVRSSRAG